MSVKQQLHAAIDGLPESLTIEEAVERLYQAFKLKQARDRLGLDTQEIRRALQEAEADMAAGRVKPHEDVIARYQAFVDGEP